jgi:hypothetical protein
MPCTSGPPRIPDLVAEWNPVNVQAMHSPPQDGFFPGEREGRNASSEMILYENYRQVSGN